jgi:hypothetical protein
VDDYGLWRALPRNGGNQSPVERAGIRSAAFGDDNVFSPHLFVTVMPYAFEHGVRCRVVHTNTVFSMVDVVVYVYRPNRLLDGAGCRARRFHVWRNGEADFEQYGIPDLQRDDGERVKPHLLGIPAVEIKLPFPLFHHPDPRVAHILPAERFKILQPVYKGMNRLPAHLDACFKRLVLHDTHPQRIISWCL